MYVELCRINIFLKGYFISQILINYIFKIYQGCYYCCFKINSAMYIFGKENRLCSKKQTNNKKKPNLYIIYLSFGVNFIKQRRKNNFIAIHNYHVTTAAIKESILVWDVPSFHRIPQRIQLCNTFWVPINSMNYLV